MDIKIDKNLELPDNYNTKYPWKLMEVGDSFEVDIYSRTSSSMNAWNRNHPETKFSIRKGRVWRVK